MEYQMRTSCFSLLNSSLSEKMPSKTNRTRCDPSVMQLCRPLQASQLTVPQARYLRLIFDLLEAGASTVVYEAASSLTSLTNNPVAVKAAASKFIELSIKEADNNVKLIVLERVEQLRKRNEGVLDDLIMEILRVLSSPDLDVRKKALDLAMEMVSSKNVEEVVMLLKKELSKTVDEQYEKVCKLPFVVQRKETSANLFHRTRSTDLF